MDEKQKAKLLNEFIDAALERDDAAKRLRLAEGAFRDAEEAVKDLGRLKRGDVVTWTAKRRDRTARADVEAEVTGEIVSVSVSVYDSGEIVWKYRARPYKKDGTPSLLGNVAEFSYQVSGQAGFTLKEAGAGLLKKANDERRARGEVEVIL